MTIKSQDKSTLGACLADSLGYMSAEQSDFSEGESEWVIRRLAELLGWAGEELGDGERQP